jgi:hypothetical protein
MSNVCVLNYSLGERVYIIDRVQTAVDTECEHCKCIRRSYKDHWVVRGTEIVGIRINEGGVKYELLGGKIEFVRECDEKIVYATRPFAEDVAARKNGGE